MGNILTRGSFIMKEEHFLKLLDSILEEEDFWKSWAHFKHDLKYAVNPIDFKHLKKHKGKTKGKAWREADAKKREAQKKKEYAKIEAEYKAKQAKKKAEKARKKAAKAKKKRAKKIKKAEEKLAKE